MTDPVNVSYLFLKETRLSMKGLDTKHVNCIQETFVFTFVFVSVRSNCPSVALEMIAVKQPGYNRAGQPC